jgi:hypothetical protein
VRRLAAVLALLAAGAGPQQGVTWIKLDQAKVLATKSGNAKLIAVYVACDPRTGLSSCGKNKSESAFDDPVFLLKHKDSFYYVRVNEKKAAAELKATCNQQVLFLDGDGYEHHRVEFLDSKSLDRGMEAALDRYVSRPVTWTAYDAKATATAEESRRLLLLAFSDEKKESSELLKILEDRTLVKYHDRFLFVKIPFRRDSEEAKKWKVAQAPVLLMIDPEKGDLLADAKLRSTPADLKSKIQAALAKAESRK